MSTSPEDPPRTQRTPWDEVLTQSWRKVALTFAAAIGTALLFWQARHRSVLSDFLLHARDRSVRTAQAPARSSLLLLALMLGVPALVLSVRIVWQARKQRAVASTHRELLVLALAGLPALTLPAFEVQHPFLTAALVTLFALALANAVGREFVNRTWPFALSQRTAWWMVGAGWLLFVGCMGFLSHWRYITFHAQVCDMSWETNAVWGIVHHGVPTISVGAWFYDGKVLPQPYFNNHVPLIYYLFAPFFAIFQDGRTLLWLQAAFMGAGTFGVYLLARSLLKNQWLAVLLAWTYILNPNIQSYTLHDVHANILTIPCLLLAAGLMEVGRWRWAIGMGVLTALCREEAALYAAGLALFWLFSGGERRRILSGAGLLVFSAAWLMLVTRVIMPSFGGTPRWDHFVLFFDKGDHMGSVARALALNPVGAVYGFVSDLSMSYVVYCLLPLGFLALWGWRAAWFGLPALVLLVTSETVWFLCPGMNYSAPLVPAAVIMGIFGFRHWLEREPTFQASSPLDWHAALSGYVLATALVTNYLYGNILSKGFQLEYGYSPLRRENEYDRADMMGYVTELPTFGAQEQALWEAIRSVPADASVASSWAVNPQLSSRDVSLVIGYSGGTPLPEDRVQYLVLDKLPMMQTQTDSQIERFRTDSRFSIHFENRSAVVFIRKNLLAKEAKKGKKS